MERTLAAFILLSTIIVFGFIATMRYLEIYKAQKLGDDLGGENAGGQNSLGTGELQNLIQAAMFEAIQPVEERLGRMEKALRQLPEAKKESSSISMPLPREGDDD